MIQKLSLALCTAAALAGCATSGPEVINNRYSYDSQQHSGTVFVNERIYASDQKSCASGWREGTTHSPSGLPLSLTSRLEVEIDATYGEGLKAEFVIPVPNDLGDQVVVRDYQQDKEFMLGAETYGLVTQGTHFYAPEGFFVRVSDVEIEGWITKACIGIDRMYITDSDLTSSDNPPIQLDRVIVPYAAKQGAEIQVSFGSKEIHQAAIRVHPR